MDIVYSVSLLGLAVIVFVIFLLGVRMPNEPTWASDWLVDIWCVTIAGLIAFGACFAIKFIASINAQTLGLKEVALVSAVLITCFLIVQTLAPRRRLAEYAGTLAQRGKASESYPGISSRLTPVARENRAPIEPSLHKVA